MPRLVLPVLHILAILQDLQLTWYQKACPVCCPLQVRDGHLLVAQDDALYEYTQDTRAGCSAFGGHKQQLALLRRYVVVVSC